VIAVRSGGMITVLSALVSALSFRFRSRASLELELVALRHQLFVLRRQRPRRLRFHSADRLLWVSLYRVWSRVLDALVLVKPATVVKWHRHGFRIYWRWRSRCPGRPKTSAEIRALIRQMSRANPLWGAPRIHGELLKLGIEVSQATVGRHLPRRPKAPSPTWRSFLRNHMTAIAAVDMFVVATATFKLLYAVIVLSHHRRRVIHFEVTENPTQTWLARQITEAFPWETAPRYLIRDRDTSYGVCFQNRVRAMGIEEVSAHYVVIVLTTLSSSMTRTSVAFCLVIFVATTTLHTTPPFYVPETSNSSCLSSGIATVWPCEVG
jgi:putative transposase